MNTKLFLLLSTLLTFLPCGMMANNKEHEKIIASVTRVDAPIESRGQDGRVTISMTIHAPNRFGGFQFLITTNTKDRAEVRTEFPIGSLQSLEVPITVIEELEQQLEPKNSVETSLDDGVDPMMISQTFSVPTIKMSDLPKKPSAYILKTN